MSVIDTLITDRTQSDVSNGTEKGYYNTSDLNRVSEAMEYLVEQLWNNGYSVPGYVKGPVWSVEDIPTPDQMEQYLTSVSSIRAVVNVLKPTPNTPDSMENLTYEEANNIEQILLDVETMLNAIVAVFPKSGQSSVFAGNVFYFLDAYYGEQVSNRIIQATEVLSKLRAKAQIIDSDEFLAMIAGITKHGVLANGITVCDATFTRDAKTKGVFSGHKFEVYGIAFSGNSRTKGDRTAQFYLQREMQMEQNSRTGHAQRVDGFEAVQIGLSSYEKTGYSTRAHEVGRVDSAFAIAKAVSEKKSEVNVSNQTEANTENKVIETDTISPVSLSYNSGVIEAAADAGWSASMSVQVVRDGPWAEKKDNKLYIYQSDFAQQLGDKLVVI